MARYVVQTKQLSGQWLYWPGDRTHKATSVQRGLDLARTRATIDRAPKRLFDTKTGKVLGTFGE